MEKGKTTVDADAALAAAGDFGRYQMMMLALFSVINILSAFHYFGQTFISLVPDHWCALRGADEEADGHCLKKMVQNGSDAARAVTIPCDQGWDFYDSFGFVSLVQELEWVCVDDWKPPLGQSFFFAGSVIGTFGLGILADHVGRLHVLVASNLLAFAGNMATLLSSDVALFSASRFVAGFAADSNFVMMYIIVMEYVRPSMRTTGLNLIIGIFYCAACVVVPWVAVLTGDWKSFLLAVAAPHLIVISFYLVMPESAVWLISKGRHEDALKCFRRVAAVNGRVLPQHVADGIKAYCDQHISKKKASSGLLGLFRTPKLRRKTCILIFKSMVITLGYDAVSRNVAGLGLSPLVMFSITSTTILPACIFILLIQDRFGRKAVASGCLLVAAIFSAASAAALVFAPSPHVAVGLSFLVRLGVNAAYNSGAQYAVELVPAEVRGRGVATIHVAGYAATFFSAHILWLGTRWRPAPDSLLALLLAAGAFACLFLPETLGRTLPISLEDGEAFGEDERFFEFACCRRRARPEAAQ